ncbi:hypothetical protein HanIR_Chr05g0238381 [Helianthus annuus]|nr:hypothetical protein HanIR_Chr05g0238381 [Helianthus annuus]
MHQNHILWFEVLRFLLDFHRDMICVIFSRHLVQFLLLQCVQTWFYSLLEIVYVMLSYRS